MFSGSYSQIYLFVFCSSWLKLVASQDGDMCGMEKPDPEKTCISIRLPWNPKPIYFCTEKEKLKYRSHCGNINFNHCGNIHESALLIQTPWECCPLSSVPDHCVTMQCPQKPLNRTCQETHQDTPNHHGMGSCCPSYFCEEGSSQDCRYKRLEPSCHSPPKDKQMCVKFVDNFGCCPKFQCKGDGKPGMCPMEYRAMKLRSHIVNGTHHAWKRTSPDEVSNLDSKPDRPAPLRKHRNFKRFYHYQNSGQTLPMSPHSQNNCVGDFNCPGDMKCCSNDIGAYGDGVHVVKRHNPTWGRCTSPIQINQVDAASES